MHLRRPSATLPTTNALGHDPHEKAARYSSSSRNAITTARNNPGFLTRARIAWMSQSQRTVRWAKTAVVVLAIVALLYWLSPQTKELYQEVASHSPFTPDHDGQTPIDSSYGTDKCAKSYSRDKSIVQYVLMIDAGSTGSRIHVYKFNNCGPTPELEPPEVFKTTERGAGLSAYKDDPEAAAHSLDMLLEEAMRAVPEKLRSCSPVAVKATAGLRMVGEDAADAIIAAVRRHLENDYPFPVVSPENDGVVVMDGSLEGVYAWVTTNYLLGKIGSPDKGPTAAVFDLGGGSTQIVFEPTFKELPSGGMPEKMADGDHKYDLDFGGAKFSLYQHSHLGYGLVSASKAIHRTLIETIAEAHASADPAKPVDEWASQPVTHPCLPPTTTAEVEVELDASSPLGAKRSFNMTGPSSPAPAQCRALTEKILKKDAACTLAPCSFNGVHQPSLAKTFAREDVYIFSFFYDRTKPLGMSDSFTIREMHDLANTVCGGEPAWDVFASVPGALNRLRKNPHWCMELNFMVTLLHSGYEMPMDREVKVAKKINGNELGWCLGASLPLLAAGSGWTCKIKEVI